MFRPSSSISSSSTRRRRILAGLGWTLATLVVLDVGLQLAFPLPDDPRVPLGRLARYFDYGRSIEGKLAYILGSDDARAAPIVAAGWIARDCRPPSPPPRGRLGITVYGMSFTNHIADELERLDPAISAARFAGPGAPPSHSLACARAVAATGGDPNPVQVLGILASSLPRLLTLGGLTTTFEAPAPFTYPRYRLVDGRLDEELPLIRTPMQLRDPAAMAAYRAQLARDDALYDALVFGQRWADHSIVLRLIRRAYGQAEQRRRRRELVESTTGFADATVGAPLRAILDEFVDRARADGKLPVVVLLQDRGFGNDTLYRLVGPALERTGVAVVSSHTLARADDPASFIADGHFTPAVDRRLAEQTLALIRARLPSAPANEAVARTGPSR